MSTMNGPLVTMARSLAGTAVSIRCRHAPTLETVQLPACVAHLDVGLAHMGRDSLTHKFRWTRCECVSERVESDKVLAKNPIRNCYAW